MKDIIIRKDENGHLRAYLQTELDLGNVITNPNAECGMFHNGAMELMLGSIFDILNQKKDANYCYGELKEAFSLYFNSELRWELGIAAMNLQLVEKGLLYTIDGFVEGMEKEFNIILKDDKFVMCGKCNHITIIEKATPNNTYGHICSKCQQRDGNKYLTKEQCIKKLKKFTDKALSHEVEWYPDIESNTEYTWVCYDASIDKKIRFICNRLSGKIVKVVG